MKAKSVGAMALAWLSVSRGHRAATALPGGEDDGGGVPSSALPEERARVSAARGDWEPPAEKRYDAAEYARVRYQRWEAAPRIDSIYPREWSASIGRGGMGTARIETWSASRRLCGA